MSDYLSRLVERAGSASPAVRPVVPSLFEPVNGGVTSAAAHMARGMEPGAGAGHDSEQTDEVGAESRTNREGTASIHSISKAAANSEEPQRGEETTERKSADLINVPVATPATRVFAAESHVLVEPSAESPRPQPAVWPRTAQPTEPAQEQPTVADAKPAFNSLVSAGPKPDTRRAAPTLPFLNPVVAPVPRAPIGRRARARASFAAAADPSPTPTIHVTIGRVEVRAIMPAAPAPQPRVPSSEPKLSLDDYLRSRNGSAA